MAKKRSSSGVGHALEAFSRLVTTWSGRSWAFVIAFGTIVVWAMTVRYLDSQTHGNSS